MPAKVDTYLDLARETARGLAGSVGAWTAFLDTASRLYKMCIRDSVHPHRVVRRGVDDGRGRSRARHPL